MANETRVNIKHLLGDLRDGYATPLEEIIITELIANALDSKAHTIAITVDRATRCLSCVDDGEGMKRSALREYHNIATSGKSRGAGIGFAGVGAKLSLLLAERVITESKGGRGSTSATEWSLSGPYRAPWKFIPSEERVPTPRGTSVSIYFNDEQSHLLDEEFVRKTIVRHFHPILDETIFTRVLKYFYRTKPQFFVNTREVGAPDDESDKHWFDVHVGNGKRPIGVGYIAYNETLGEVSGLLRYIFGKGGAEDMPSGLSISTFGKVIKGGWEWLGVLPKNHERLHGIVEIPALAEILTTDKSNFLSDATSLKKYYKYRRAIQEALAPVFAQLGETGDQSENPEKIAKPIARMISSVLTHMVSDFPELEGLIGSAREAVRGRPGAFEKHGASEKIEEAPNTNASLSDAPAHDDVHKGGEADEQHKESHKRLPEGLRDEAARGRVRAPRAGLSVILAPINGGVEPVMGKIVDNVVTINTLHPAWKKARSRGLAEYHVLLSVALVLSEYLAEKSPQEFVSKFLQIWAEEKDAQGKLFV